MAGGFRLDSVFDKGDNRNKYLTEEDFAMYYCKNCGEVYQTDEAVMCVKCKTPKNKGKSYCYHCGSPVEPKAKACMKCGVATGVSADVYAVLSLIMGVLSLLVACCVDQLVYFPASAGVILALVSLKKNGKSGLAIAGLVCSSLGILSGIISYYIYLAEKGML